MGKMHYITKKDIRLPKRKADSHKGDNGKVLVVGGSKDYVGAVALAGLAALRSGCDLVKIIAPEKVAWAINSYSPDLITEKIAPTCERVNSLTRMSHDFFRAKDFKIVAGSIKKFDVLLIGNGIGLNIQTKKFCKKAVRNIKKLKVIDADAIKSISMEDAENSIITPHQKELGHFLINSEIGKNIIKKIDNGKNIVSKSRLIKDITQKFLNKNNIILLKGKIDIIISKDEIFYNKTGNAGMTKGGTGDVLAGLCAGFLAQSKVWQESNATHCKYLLQSAINAAYFNGLIGDILLKKKKGFSYLASDMVEEINKILKKPIKN